MKKCLLLASFIFCLNHLFAQNVGIGTTTPVSKLTIQTALNTTGFTHIGGSNEIIVADAIGGVSASWGTTTNHAFRIMSNNTGRISIYPAGEIVVGDNATGAIGKFTVQSAPGTNGITNTNGTIILSTFLGGTQPFAYIGTISNHALSFYTNNSQSQMILTTSGRVGIGTNTPGATLEVSGNTIVDGNIYTGGYINAGDGNFFGNIGVGAFSSAGTGVNILNDAEAIRINGSQPYITFYTGSDYKGYLWKKGADDIELGTAGSNTNGKVLLGIKGTPYLTLQANGRVSIGPGIAGIWGVPALTVNGLFTLKDVGNGFNEWALSSEGEFLNFYFNGDNKSWIDIDGDYVTPSDKILKEDISDYKTVLPGLLKLNVSTYHYRSNTPAKKSFGLVAQNVAEYFPEIISETKDKTGQPLIGVAYNKTGVLAIKAIQEQQVIIEGLEKRIAALEQLLSEKK